MFSRLDIHNFQSIEDLSLELGKVTVVTGPSNIGKSAIVRALNTLVKNDYSSSYMRDGHSSCYIKLYEGEKFVQFNRKGTSSSYVFSGSQDTYTKIGKSVPQDIKDFLNMNPIQLDSDYFEELNIVRQFDAPFLLSKSGYDIGKVFSRLLNLSVVSSATRNVSNDILQSQRTIGVYDTLIEEKETYISENKFIVDKFNLLETAKSKLESYNKEDEFLEKLGEFINQEEKTCIKISELQEELFLLSDLDKFESKDNLDLLDMLINSLGVSLSKLTVLEKKLNLIDSSKVEDNSSLEQIFRVIFDLENNNLAQQEFNNILGELSTVKLENISELEELQKLITMGDSINSQFKETATKYNKLMQEISEVESAYKEFIKENPICPLTKKPFNESCLAMLEVK